MAGGAFLAEIRRKTDEDRDDDDPPDVDAQGFPWTLPVFAGLQRLVFDAPVTFLVGENGCGKSTLLEALAIGSTAVAVGSRDLARDPSLEPARRLAAGFRFVRRRNTRTRMFLRAEDVLGFTRRIEADLEELDELKESYRRTLKEGSYGQRLAMSVAAGQRMALASRYGEEPDAKSHGETFLGILRERLVPNGLYFLDEPETPLSPVRVLALITLIRGAVEAGGQFVVATHSPILMALPGARILVFEDGALVPTPWAEVEHVRLTRAFLEDPDAFLRRLEPDIG